jgi:hypothetical protein
MHGSHDQYSVLERCISENVLSIPNAILVIGHESSLSVSLLLAKFTVF